jgi:glutamate synthase domain-containing protein 1
MVFLPAEDNGEAERLEGSLHEHGLRVLGWREVPIEREALGTTARASLPEIRQVLVLPPPGCDAAHFEHRLYLARKSYVRGGGQGYVCSLSSRTVVYKALCVGGELDHFYPDLRDPLFEAAIAVFHQRFSPNTLPSWQLAQPFRMLAHNGEINTLPANRAWIRAREAELPAEMRPALAEGGSDSAALDQAFELLVRGGRGVAHAMSVLVPPAWEDTGEAVPPDARAFFRFHAPFLEPWDGPAGLAFTDGRLVGASLDRNGLRPCRFKIIHDGLVVAGSEAGVLCLDDEDVVLKGRLGPGQMLAVDTEAQRLWMDEALKAQLAAERPYAEWAQLVRLEPDLSDAPAYLPADELLRLQLLHGLTREELSLVIEPMAGEGKEPIWSMGDDTPVAPLARAPRPVYSFFAQRFAQVTNPAIDSLRETRVMSLRTWLGPRPPLLAQEPYGPLLELASPVLDGATRRALRRGSLLAGAEVSCLLHPDEDLPTALERVSGVAETAVRGGAACLFLTDLYADEHAAPLPMALALGAVHQHLLRVGLRGGVSLVAEAGDCWDVHHLAVLVGCGADAVAPWLALATVHEMGGAEGERNLVDALETGLRKVMSKMGISTVASYRGGQIFEILGLGDEVVERCFPGTPSRIGGLGWRALEKQVRRRHRAAWPLDDVAAAAVELPDPGRIRFRRGDDTEHHAWEPAAVRALQKAVGSARRAGGEGDPKAWEEFRGGSDGVFARDLCDLLDMITAPFPVPLDQVEPAGNIVRRFVTSGMSLGALSPEAHQALTVAMNHLGARSNSGEGGEDPAVYTQTDGDRHDNKIKQVASGRFGVTAEYLAHAEEYRDQGRAGLQAGRGRAVAGAQGQRADRAAAARAARDVADQPAAAPRHL